MNDSFATVFTGVAQLRGDAPALVQGARRASWADLAERSARLAGALDLLGVGPGRNVGLCMRNRAEYLEATWAAFALGATPINLNYRYRSEELAYVLDDADAAVVVCDQAASASVLDATGSGGPGEVVVLGPGYEGLIAAAPASAPRFHPSGEDVFMIYTGGTTGPPKGVMWRHRDLAGWLGYPAYRAAGLRFPLDAGDAVAIAREAARAGDVPVTLLACPLVHGTAFFFGLCALALGGTVVMLEGTSLDPDEIWRVVEVERVTQLVIVGDAQARPAVAALDAAAGAGRSYDTSSLRRVFSSGMVWSARTKQGLLRHTGATLIDMLGSSEGGPFGLDVVGPGDAPRTARFRLTERAEVLRDDGTPVERGAKEAGRLAITEPIPLGYHKDPQRSAATFPIYAGRRWAVPGDYASVDADGTLHLLGRGSTCINSGGEKVWPEEVEATILAHPSVRDCVVVGRPDDCWGEAVVAVVSLAGEETPDLAEWARARLAAYKVPKRFVIAEEVQRGAAGKADHAWARQVADGSGPVRHPP